MSIEAMKQALEALEEIHPGNMTPMAETNWNAAITALRKAIEEAERAEKQKPRCVVIVEVFGKDWRLDYMSLPVGKHKLYTQEYVYNAPQRKPLTDEQLRDALRSCPHDACEALRVRWLYAKDFARAIEDAHNIKESS